MKLKKTISLKRKGSSTIGALILFAGIMTLSWIVVQQITAFNDGVMNRADDVKEMTLQSRSGKNSDVDLNSLPLISDYLYEEVSKIVELPMEERIKKAKKIKEKVESQLWIDIDSIDVENIDTDNLDEALIKEIEKTDLEDETIIKLKENIKKTQYTLNNALEDWEITKQDLDNLLKELE